jgi:hypothetical protein
VCVTSSLFFCFCCPLRNLSHVVRNEISHGDCVCVCVYLGEFICILDGAIIIYNTYLLHVYIDNMYF